MNQKNQKYIMVKLMLQKYAEKLKNIGYFVDKHTSMSYNRF
jgi:hypothetical protein